MNDISKGAIILSIGTAVPSFKVSQQLHADIIESANGMSRHEKLLLRKIYSHSGVDSRYSVLDEFLKEDQSANRVFHPANENLSATVTERMNMFDEHATGLGYDAATDAFNKSGVKAGMVTHLITFSCT